MTRPSVSVCFPAYNESASLNDVVTEGYRLLSASGIDYEILVCDDGSTDTTPQIVEALVRAIPGLRAFRHQQNQGIFLTFEHLYAEARKEFVFLNSTDRQWDTAVLFDLLPLAASADVILASRRNKHYGPARRLVSWAFNAAARIVFGVPTHDAGAIKLMRGEIIRTLPLVSRSPFSEAERLIRASRAGYRILDHPVDTAPRAVGRGRGTNWGLVTGAAADMVRVWVALRREDRVKRNERGRPPAPLPHPERGPDADRR